MNVMQIVILEKFSLLGEEWMAGQETYEFTAIALRQPTKIHSISKEKFSIIKTIIGIETMHQLKLSTQVRFIN